MSKINSTALNPGMVLGEDIYLPDGRLLMKKGTILDFEHLRSVRVGGSGKSISWTPLKRSPVPVQPPPQFRISTTPEKKPLGKKGSPNAIRTSRSYRNCIA